MLQKMKEQGLAHYTQTIPFHRNWEHNNKNNNNIIIIIIIIIINCSWVDTLWQWLFYIYTKYEIGYY
jgi:hypothetical protein